jgi:hypothetical protein
MTGRPDLPTPMCHGEVRRGDEYPLRIQWFTALATTSLQSRAEPWRIRARTREFLSAVTS